MKIVPLFLLVLILCAEGVHAKPMEPITDLAFIDHYNLRRMERFDEAGLRARVTEIKSSLDKAQEHGVGTYILFSRSFEHLVNYDFTVPGLGDLSGVVYPMDSDHRKKQVLYAECLNEVLDYAEGRGIKVIFHTNQFDFPRSLYKLAGDKMGGTAPVCPGKQMGFDALQGKIREFFTKFPKVSGLQVTISETQVKPTDCKCDACKALSPEERLARVAVAINGVCKSLGKTVMIRTWGGFETPEAVSKLPKDIICSTKFTLPDFHLNNYPNPVMGMYGERQEIEYDGWGEYSGYNLFPCYYGDAFAPRIKQCAERGVPRMGIRLNWDPGMRYIFDKPYGNAANIFVFVGLAAKPDANPDDLLRDYIAEVYPQSAREAAFRLYKRSFAIQSTWLVWRGGNANDHSRVWSGGANRVRAQIGKEMPESYEETARAIAERRKSVDDAYHEALDLVKALGPDVPADWKRDLEHWARNSWFVAQGNCDNIILFAAYREHQRGNPVPDTAAIAKDARRRMDLWKSVDPEMYDLMMGYGPGRMLDELAKHVAGN